jgi:septum formation protein
MIKLSPSKNSSVNPVIYLASQSPRRHEILLQIGVPHLQIQASVVELVHENESPRDYVSRLSREKALAGLATVNKDALEKKPVLGADTIVVFDNHILEKPLDAEHAATMLRQLSGKVHQVMTAVTLMTEQKVATGLSITEVVFRDLHEAEIVAYWKTGEPQDKAGGYAVQGLGAVFVEEIRGSYSGVVGLPIEQTRTLLEQFELRWWQL